MSKDGFEPDISRHYETVDLESIIDKDAYMNGFDKDGYDKMGYNKSGYDKNDFDEEGYHRVTDTKFNEQNIDKRGFNDTGIHKVTGTKFDENDFDVDGIHKVTGGSFDEEGYDVRGFDEHSRDKDGFNYTFCVDKNGFNRYGYRNKFYFDGTHGVTGTKFDENNFDTNEIHKVTGGSFDEEGYDVRGFDKDGYDKEGYSEYGGFDKHGVDRDGRSAGENPEWDNTDSTDPVFKNESPDPYVDKEYIREQFGTGKPFHPDDDNEDEETRD